MTEGTMECPIRMGISACPEVEPRLVPPREHRASEFMAALRKIAVPGRHENGMQHRVGHFQRDLDEGVRCELLDADEDRRSGLIPRIAAVTWILPHAKLLETQYLLGQTCLIPQWKELRVRYHVQVSSAGWNLLFPSRQN